MANVKLSQIVASPGIPTGTDSVVGVSGATDYLYTLNQISAAVGARVRLTSDLTYHVSNGGNDVTGIGNTGNPFKTLQHAYAVATQFDFNKHYLYLLLDDDGGTPYVGLSYGDPSAGAAADAVDLLNCLGVVVMGNNVTPANVQVAQSNFAASFAVYSNTGIPLYISGLKTVGNNYSIDATSQVILGEPTGSVTTNLIFNTTNTFSMINAPIYDSISGTVIVNAPASINRIVSATGDCSLFVDAWTINGNPTLGAGLITALGGNFILNGTAFSGSATGPAFAVGNGYKIEIENAASTASMFPSGCSAGFIDRGAMVYSQNGRRVARSVGAAIDTAPNYQTPTTGFSLQLNQLDGNVVLEPAGTLASGTIVLPVRPYDGQTIWIHSTQIITSLTYSPSAGQSIANGAPTTIAAGGLHRAYYRSTGSKWYIGA